MKLFVIILSILLLGLTACSKEETKDLTNQAIQEETKGLIGVDLCKGKPIPNCYCLQVYDPVCGCDGRTYGNACEANCAGVKSYKEGACGGSNLKTLTQAEPCKGKPIPFCMCPHVYDPVCGCDGITYSNSCFATCAGVKSYKEGACGGGGIGIVR